MQNLWYLAQIVLVAAAIVYGVPYLIELWREDGTVELWRSEE